MEKLSAPSAMLKLGIKYPTIYIVKSNEKHLVPVGTPFIISDRDVNDTAVWLTLLMSKLMKTYPYINWETVYKQQTGHTYKEVKFHMWHEPEDAVDHSYSYGTDELQEDPSWTIENCIGQEAAVSIDILSELNLLPHFLDDIREAIKVNITQMYAWQDGYNKKLGMCSGYMTEQPPNRNLMIIDISSSVPRGVSASLLLLMKTMTDICNADLIITASQSRFWTNEEVAGIDEDEIAQWRRGNEGYEFAQIINNLDLTVYSNLIAFGDSDNPYPIDTWIDNWNINHVMDGVTSKPCDFKQIHSFWVSDCYDRYGCTGENGVGYCRWARELNPSIPIEHHYDWVEVFR